MVNFRKIAVFLVATVGVSSIAFSASTLSDGDDPIAVLAKAQATSGLWGENLKPLHLVADYEILDVSNKVTATGVYEMWRSRDGLWERTYKGTHYSATEYLNGRGYGRYGDPSPSYAAFHGRFELVSQAPWPEALIVEAVSNPIEALQPTYVLHPTAHFLDLPESSESVACIAPSDRFSSIRRYYCVDRQTGALQSSLSDFVTTHYQQIRVFDGRTVASEMKMTINGHDLLKVHIRTLESLSKGDEARLSMPRPEADYLPLPPVAIGNIVVGHNLGTSSDSREEVVVVSGVKDDNGRPRQLKIIESPDLSLNATALERIESEKPPYGPCLSNGDPVECSFVTFVTFRVPR